MKIPINLASEPFRRDRAMVAASVVVSLVLVATLAGLAFLILLDRSQLADVRRELSGLNQELRRVTAEQAKLDAVLKRPENTEVLERSVLLNQVIYRKAISWTKLLEDLGKIEPYSVQVINIRPFVNKEDQITLDMQVGAQTYGAIIEFLKALESSPLFSAAQTPTTQAPTQTEPLFRSRILVNYAQKL
jgi:Tfp pilus assembly protein PilN